MQFLTILYLYRINILTISYNLSHLDFRGTQFFLGYLPHFLHSEYFLRTQKLWISAHFRSKSKHVEIVS
jgi:hypothetical protein